MTVVAGALLQLRLSALTPMSVVTSYLTPLALVFVIMSQRGGPVPELLIGAVAAGTWNTLLMQMFLALVQERAWGTTQLIAASPTGLAAPLAGRLLGATAQGLLILPITWVFVALVWRGRPDLGPFPLAQVSLLEIIAGLVGPALVLTAVMSRVRFYAGMLNGVFPLTVVLMGLFIPVTALPPPVRVLGYLLAPTWGMRAVVLRSYLPLLVGVPLAVAWIALGLWYLSRLERQRRSSASADFA